MIQPRLASRFAGSFAFLPDQRLPLCSSEALVLALCPGEPAGRQNLLASIHVD